MKQISGGSISATMLSAIFRGVDIFLEAGRCLGTAIRRAFTKNVCVLG